MSEAPGDGALPGPGRPLDAVVHAAVLLTAAVVVTVATSDEPSNVSLAAVLRLNLPWVLGTAVAAHARPALTTDARALAACVVLALVVRVFGEASLVAFEASAHLTGLATGSAGRAEQWAADAVRGYADPSSYLFTLGSAVSLFLASTRRGAWTEGLAIAAPSSAAAFTWHRLWNTDSSWTLARTFGAWCLAFALLVPLFTRAAATLRRRAESG